MRATGGIEYSNNRVQEILSGTEQNGLIERFFCSLKEECVWQHVFQTFEEARGVIRDWLRRYKKERPHQALGYRSPVQFRALQSTQVA
jgi:putative transposase